MTSNCNYTCQFWNGYECQDKEEFIEEGTTSLCCRYAPLSEKSEKSEKSKKQNNN
jgi:hypothetical protein